MMGVLAVLFWCWFGVSMVILIRRVIRRTTGRGASVDARPPIAWPPIHEIDPVPADGDARAPIFPSETTGAASTDAAPMRTMFTREPRVNRDRTIAAALDGIRMPCDLAPLTGASENFDRRAAFFTVGYPAEAVAPEIADELERIGMAFKALSENTALARRDDLEVRVAVHAVGPAINGVADRTFPTAPENSVVVEFELAP